MAEKYSQMPNNEHPIGYCENCNEPLWEVDHPIDTGEFLFCDGDCQQSYEEEEEIEEGEDGRLLK